MADLPWRQGTRVPEHIYDANGRPLVTMPSAELAAFVVAAVNGEAGAALSAEIAPPLRTRAEVDTEIAATIRNWHAGQPFKVAPLMPSSFAGELDRLCAEPTVPEVELPWDCPTCRRRP